MKTKSENAVIAKFVGLRYDEDQGAYRIPIQSPYYEPSFKTWASHYCDPDYPGLIEGYYIRDLQFHNNWEWLIGAVEFVDRANIMFEDQRGLSISIQDKWCGVYANRYGADGKDYGEQLELVSCFAETKRDAVHEALVEFIYLYNETYK